MILFKRFLLTILCCWLFACGGTQPTKPSLATSGKGLNTLTPAEKSTYDKALTLLEDGNAAKASSQLQLLSLARADVADIWLNLALAQYKQQQFDESLVSIKRVLSLMESSAEAHNLAALISIEFGNFAHAKTHYERALQLKPNYTQALFNMALLNDVYLQDVRTAITYYERYMAIKPEDTQTQDWLSHLKGSL